MSIRKVAKEEISSMSHIDGGRAAAKKPERNFVDQLNKVHKGMVQEEMETLLKDIDKQGKLLGDSQNIKDLRKYKKLIQKFMDNAVKKSYDLTEQSGFDRRGRHKVYTMIETVNKSLESLTEMVISEQKDNLDVLDKIGEIRGMLVDIYS